MDTTPVLALCQGPRAGRLGADPREALAREVRAQRVHRRHLATQPACVGSDGETPGCKANLLSALRRCLYDSILSRTLLQWCPPEL